MYCAMMRDRQTEQHDSQDNTHSRRTILKSMGGAVAGVGGISLLASEAKAASFHDIEVIADGSSGTYAIVLPDPNASFTDKESDDTIIRRSNSTQWVGNLDRGDDCPYLCTESDNASFYGNKKCHIPVT
jgi:hypothetical protein